MQKIYFSDFFSPAEPKSMFLEMGSIDFKISSHPLKANKFIMKLICKHGSIFTFAFFMASSYFAFAASSFFFRRA